MSFFSKLEDPSVKTSKDFLYLISSFAPQMEEISKTNLNKTLAGRFFFKIFFEEFLNE